MRFNIQVGNPRLETTRDYKDIDAFGAIESIFVMNTENVIINWNYICIPLSYKYDISYMLKDILELLERLEFEDCGKMEIYWLPDTFRTDWYINWKDGNMKIHSRWECTVGRLEKILNEQSDISISIDEFIKE